MLLITVCPGATTTLDRSSRLSGGAELSFLHYSQSHSVITQHKIKEELHGCIVWNAHYTVIGSKRLAISNARGSLGPPESSTQTASRSLQPFLQGSLGDRPTDRLTDHATWPVTIGRIYVCSTTYDAI